jgi:hypothetical protein
VPGQSRLVDMSARPMAEFSGNEVYASGGALQLWSVGAWGHIPVPGVGESVVKDFAAWHVSGYVYYNYEVSHLTFDGYTYIGDVNALRRNVYSAAIYGGDYTMKDFVLRNGNIQNAEVGIFPSPHTAGGTQIYENTYLRNYFNVYIQHIGGSFAMSEVSGSRTMIFRNIRFAQADTPDRWFGDPKANFVMKSGWPTLPCVDFLQRDQVFVYAYNGNPADNFRLYYDDQAATAPAPQMVESANGFSPGAIGITVEGLTNRQAWDLFGVAMAGEVAPDDATTRDLIAGLVKAF